MSELSGFADVTVPEATTELQVNAAAYYDTEPDPAISNFIDSVVNLPHPSVEEDSLHPIEEMQE